MMNRRRFPMQKTPKILVFGSCWPTNIGNAFVHIGIINSMKEALGSSAEIHHFGAMSSYLFWTNNSLNNNLNIGEIATFDYVVVGGMTQCEGYFESIEPTLNALVKNGTKIIIAGGGAGHYSPQEVIAVREWMKKIPIAAFISRDEYSFENYADLATSSFNGLDSAFFVSDGFCPLPLNISGFNIINFDFFQEPGLVNAGKQLNVPNNNSKEVNVSKPSSKTEILQKFFSNSDKQHKLPELDIPYLDMEGRKVIRTHHAPWPTFSIPNQFEKNDTLISDLPSDYLTLYSQAETVYSDRIHACVVTLALGNKAMLFGRDNPRIKMFERIGAGEILKNPVKADQTHLAQLKSAQINFLRSTIV
jgi:hypothetical protein